MLLARVAIKKRACAYYIIYTSKHASLVSAGLRNSDRSLSVLDYMIGLLLWLRMLGPYTTAYMYARRSVNRYTPKTLPFRGGGLLETR